MIVASRREGEASGATVVGFAPLSVIAMNPHQTAKLPRLNREISATRGPEHRLLPTTGPTEQRHGYATAHPSEPNSETFGVAWSVSWRAGFELGRRLLGVWPEPHTWPHYACAIAVQEYDAGVLQRLTNGIDIGG